jgi:decaprenylphosphoryl-5-phosphoribose phosphatase
VIGLLRSLGGALVAADRWLLVAMRSYGHWQPLERAVGVLSRSGEHSRLWFLIAGTGLIGDRRERGRYLRLAIALVTTEVANAALKLVFMRQRPVLEDLPALTGARSQRSFPSAHAATSFAAAACLDQRAPRLPLYGLAGAMALSRPYLGVHYPSDLVGGIALGTAIGLILRRPARPSGPLADVRPT